MGYRRLERRPCLSVTQRWSWNRQDRRVSGAVSRETVMGSGSQEMGFFWWRELGETPKGRRGHTCPCAHLYSRAHPHPHLHHSPTRALWVACSRGSYALHHRAAPCIHTYTPSGAPKPHRPARYAQHCSGTLAPRPHGQRFPAAPDQVTATGVNTSAPPCPPTPRPPGSAAINPPCGWRGSWWVLAAPWLWGRRW